VQCLYCENQGDSLEHVLPAAFGEFRDAPNLVGRICKSCNNSRLGVLDEQLTRSGPEAFLRRFYGVQGRTSHPAINPFYRGSAGGKHLEMLSHDPKLGFDVLIECEKGVFRQVRQLVFVEKTGSTYHVPIREGTTPEELLAAVQELGVKEPCDTHVLYDPVTEEWVLELIKTLWPASTAAESTTLASTVYDGAVGKIVVTNRYFRAVAKIGFHYFLAVHPKYTGHERMFSDVKRFIVRESNSIDEVNAFVGTRGNALLGPMLNPDVRPNGWRAHILTADTTPTEHLSFVQTFVTEDWRSPVYVVRLAPNIEGAELQTTGHAFVYDSNGPEGRYSGDALPLEVTHANWPAPPLGPAIVPGATPPPSSDR
jgi:hypothetical protein